MNIAKLFLRYNFFELGSWIKAKNFLLIILNNLSSIYDQLLNKNFFYSIRLKNAFQNIELSSIHDAQKMLILFLKSIEICSMQFL